MFPARCRPPKLPPRPLPRSRQVSRTYAWAGTRVSCASVAGLAPWCTYRPMSVCLKHRVPRGHGRQWSGRGLCAPRGPAVTQIPYFPYSRHSITTVLGSGLFH